MDDFERSFSAQFEFFSTDKPNKCIYCGENADTKEHVPSKVFLNILPDNTRTVPACYRCNNSFSGDEAYTAILIEKYHHFFDPNYRIRPKIKTLISKKSEMSKWIDKELNAEVTLVFGSFSGSRVERILGKLAVGHATRSLGMYSFSGLLKPTKISFFFRDSENEKRISDYLGMVRIKAIPDIESNFITENLVLDSEGNAYSIWVEIEKGQYRYLIYQQDEKVVVKIVIGEFLYSTVLLTPEEE